MAEKKTPASSKKAKPVIDPIYTKFTRSVIRALGSTEFYLYFMAAISGAHNEFQFSNRRLEKTVDVAWVDAIEESLPGFQNIIAMPRNVIKEDELIVNVANAKKTGSDVVRHLSQHAALVENYEEESGQVRPSRVMQKYREDTVGIYENRLVFTALEKAFHFVKIRHDALFSAMSDEYGAKLKVRSDMQSATEKVHLDMFVHIKDIDSALDTDEKNQDIFGRISRLYRVLGMLMNSTFAQEMDKLNRVKGAVTKTNVLKRNPNYKEVVKLWEFLRSYDDIGYSIRVVEQNPEINETFQRDIFHNILFNYIILKGYLEDRGDREISTVREKKRTLKPKFIHQIIEELTEDYDLPDVEVRKVLIEELTKAQLMQEEAAERRRLVEEQAKRKKEEAERLRQEKLAEQERLRKEREAEKERIRQEKAAEQERLRQERMARELEDRRRSKLFKQELSRFWEKLADQLAARELEREREKNRPAAEQDDFADAVAQMEALEQRKKEAAERLKKRKQEERERIKREKQEAAERARREEQERLEREAKAQAEEQARQEAEQRAKDMEALRGYISEMETFQSQLDTQRQRRHDYIRQLSDERQKRLEERRSRREQRSSVN